MSATIERVEEEREEEVEMNDNDEQNDEHDDEQPVEKHVEKVSVKVPVIPDYAQKAVKKLSKDERQKLLDGFEQGTEDPYFKVIRMKNGAIRITKRAIPLLTDVKNAVDANSQKVESKALKHSNGSRLTNEQLLMEHIMDLEARFECMRLKHKKLKKRYNELESTIYEDVDDKAVSQPVEQVNEKVVEQPVEKVDELPVEQVDEQPRTTMVERPRRGRMSWRDAISYMK